MPRTCSAEPSAVFNFTVDGFIQRFSEHEIVYGINDTVAPVSTKKSISLSNTLNAAVNEGALPLAAFTESPSWFPDALEMTGENCAVYCYWILQYCI